LSFKNKALDETEVISTGRCNGFNNSEVQGHFGQFQSTWWAFSGIWEWVGYTAKLYISVENW